MKSSYSQTRLTNEKCMKYEIICFRREFISKKGEQIMLFAD